MPACDSMEMSMFVHNDTYIEADEDLKAEFLRILDANYDKESPICIKFEVPADFQTIICGTLTQYLWEWAASNGISLPSYSWGYWDDAYVIYIML